MSPFILFFNRLFRSPARLGLGLALALTVLALLLACGVRAWPGFPTSYDPQRVWPQPPEPPRVAFLMEIRSQEDLFQSAGFWRSVGEWIGGKPDTTMVRPFAIAMHPAGGLLVTDPGCGLVHFYDWSRRRYVPIGPMLKGGLPSPVGVASLKDGRILVSDSRLKSVTAFDVNGKPLAPFVATDQLKRPAGIAVSEERGEVYVADVTEHCVRVFDLHGKPLRSIGKHGDQPGEFNFPTHLALDAKGRLLVTDSMNFRVQCLTPEGAFVSAFGKPGDSPGHFSKPKGVAADAQGNVMVIEGLYDSIQFFNESGQLLLGLGNSGGRPGEFWLPAGLCFDRQNQLLFVADSYNKRVQVFRMLGPSGQ